MARSHCCDHCRAQHGPRQLVRSSTRRSNGGVFLAGYWWLVQARAAPAKRRNVVAAPLAVIGVALRKLLVHLPFRHPPERSGSRSTAAVFVILFRSTISAHFPAPRDAFFALSVPLWIAPGGRSAGRLTLLDLFATAPSW
jgi:hypothetical protein